MPGHRQPRSVERDRKAEVADLRDARAVEPDVSRLQIAVHDAARVRVLEPRAHLLRDAHRLFDRQTMIVLRLQHRREISAGHVLRDDVRLRVLVAGVEHRDDVRMIAQPPHRLCLALHARQAIGIEAFDLDDGERYVTVELLVVRQVDPLTPALAQKRLHGVAAVGEGCGEGARYRRLGLGRRGSCARRQRRPTSLTELGRGRVGRATGARTGERDRPRTPRRSPASLGFTWPQAGHCIVVTPTARAPGRLL